MCRAVDRAVDKSHEAVISPQRKVKIVVKGRFLGCRVWDLSAATQSKF